MRQRLDRLLKRRDALAPIHKAIESDDADVAIGLCRQHIDANTRYAGMCQKLLGNLYCQRGDYAQAEEVYQTVLAQRSLDWALVGMAEVKRSEERRVGKEWRRERSKSAKTRNKKKND